MKFETLFNLLESRSNSAYNQKIPIMELINDEYKKTTDKICDIPNLFMSITDIEKLGIFPKSSYNTPLGIYSYPVNYVVQMVKGASLARLPFAGDKPFVNVFKAGGNLLDLNKINETELRNLKQQLKELCVQYNVPPGFIDHFHKQGKEDEKTKQTPGGYFWYITMRLSSKMSKTKQSGPVMWNKIFRDLNISGCYDSGTGIIHSNEPTQAVFFSTRSINNIKRYNNKHFTPPDLYQILKSTSNVEFALSKIQEHGMEYMNFVPEPLLIKILDVYPQLVKYINFPSETVQYSIGMKNIDNLLHIKKQRIIPRVLNDCMMEQQSKVTQDFVCDLCDKFPAMDFPDEIIGTIININYKLTKVLNLKIHIKNHIVPYIKYEAERHNDLKFFEDHFKKP